MKFKIVYFEFEQGTFIQRDPLFVTIPPDLENETILREFMTMNDEDEYASWQPYDRLWRRLDYNIPITNFGFTNEVIPIYAVPIYGLQVVFEDQNIYFNYADARQKLTDEPLNIRFDTPPQYFYVLTDDNGGKKYVPTSSSIAQILRMGAHIFPLTGRRGKIVIIGTDQQRPFSNQAPPPIVEF